MPEELDASEMKFVNFPLDLPRDFIHEYLSQNHIPLLNIFHVGHEDFEPLIDPVHDIGAKMVLHQTIHWPDDTILKSSRLEELDKIVAPTEYAKNVFQSIRKLPPNMIEVIPHGVDTNRFYRRPTILRKTLGIRDDQVVILYSGRLGFWKGVHEIIPIMRPLIKKYDCVFIIRGGWFWGQKEGEVLGKIFTRLSTNNPNIIFLPEWQSPSYMEELYAMTDILIFNSAHEGFGVPLIEAQAVGAVPITTAISNHVEILGSTGQRGLLLSPEVKVGVVNDGTELKVASSDLLYGAVGWLLDNPEERMVMGRNGVLNVRTRFKLSDVAQKWLDLYDGMLAGHDMDTAMKERLA